MRRRGLSRRAMLKGAAASSSALSLGLWLPSAAAQSAPLRSGVLTPGVIIMLTDYILTNKLDEKHGLKFAEPKIYSTLSTVQGDFVAGAYEIGFGGWDAYALRYLAGVPCELLGTFSTATMLNMLAPANGAKTRLRLRTAWSRHCRRCCPPTRPRSGTSGWTAAAWRPLRGGFHRPRRGQHPGDAGPAVRGGRRGRRRARPVRRRGEPAAHRHRASPAAATGRARDGLRTPLGGRPERRSAGQRAGARHPVGRPRLRRHARLGRRSCPAAGAVDLLPRPAARRPAQDRTTGCTGSTGSVRGSPSCGPCRGRDATTAPAGCRSSPRGACSCSCWRRWPS